MIYWVLYPILNEGEMDADLINAGKESVTAVKSASFFDGTQSFAMIRDGHIDLEILGAMEINLANYTIPGKLVKGMGGAKSIIVVMEHTNKCDKSKLKKECILPLTDRAVVDKLITDLGIFEFTQSDMRLIELMELREKTEADFEECIKEDTHATRIY